MRSAIVTASDLPSSAAHAIQPIRSAAGFVQTGIPACLVAPASGSRPDSLVLQAYEGLSVAVDVQYCSTCRALPFGPRTFYYINVLTN
jgi:hypothetical protein